MRLQTNTAIYAFLAYSRSKMESGVDIHCGNGQWSVVSGQWSVAGVEVRESKSGLKSLRDPNVVRANLL